VVPPLRERREEIPELCEVLAARYAEKFGLDDLRLAPGLVSKLAAADWPGNVRQLENTIARLAALSTGGILEEDAFDGERSAPTEAEGGGPSLREAVEAFERNLIARTLADAGGNQSEAARRLGTSRVTLLDKIKRYKLASREPA
jgi:two-component system response regulator AtoC